jgi:SH3-domain binding protein 5
LQAQVEAQRSASKFQQANGIYKAAKETVTLAEQRLFAGNEQGKIAFDSAWQEMLNHATAKVGFFVSFIMLHILP